MLPRNHPDRIQIAFDDHRLVANAGLLLPVTLAHHLGLSQLGAGAPGSGRPLAADLLQTPQQELAEAPALLDLAVTPRAGPTPATLCRGGSVTPRAGPTPATR